ncbi:MAG: right-handed parallel beta-helix repeat-containing protein [Candidatus Sulfotelmatobacter sp.]
MHRVLCLCLLISLSTIATAATINVPADQPTIQSGINAANNGDVVLVAPGTYIENINFNGKAIVVKSSGGAKVTFIDGFGLNSVVTFDSNEGLKSVLRGFTIQHGNTLSEGGGIYIRNASPTVVANIVSNNTAAIDGAGIAVTFSSALVQGNTVTNNSQTPGYSGGEGGGIEVGGEGAARIIGNVVENNSWASAEGGGIALYSAGTPILENNIIRANLASDYGGGIYIVGASNALIVQNLVYNNTLKAGLNFGEGAGIYILVPYGYAGPVLVNNTLVGTSALGSAVYASGFYDQVQFYNNLIIGAAGTSALYCDDTYDKTPPVLTNNDGYSSDGTGIAGACSPQSTENGNLSVDPMFDGKANFHVKASSPIIGAGDVSAPNLPAKDLSGGPRIVDGKIDMGAYEYPQ